MYWLLDEKSKSENYEHLKEDYIKWKYCICYSPEIATESTWVFPSYQQRKDHATAWMLPTVLCYFFPFAMNCRKGVTSAKSEKWSKKGS